DDISFYSSNSAVAMVGEDGIIHAGIVGDAVVTVIYKTQEILVPVNVEAPQVGVVNVGSDGGLVENADGYQVAIAPSSLSRPVDVEIRTMTEADLPIPALPEEYGWTFGGAFELDFDGAAMSVPVQLGIPTNLAPGSSVIFYRYSDLPTEDGWQKGWQQIDSGIVDENGIARTKSPPDIGDLVGGFFTMLGVDDDTIKRTENTVTAALGLQPEVGTAVTASIGGGYVGGMSSSKTVYINLPIGGTFSAFVSTIKATAEFVGTSRTVSGAIAATQTAVTNFINDAQHQILRSPTVDKISYGFVAGGKTEITIVGKRLIAPYSIVATADLGSTENFWTWVVFGDGDLTDLAAHLDSQNRNDILDMDLPLIEFGGMKALLVRATFERPFNEPTFEQLKFTVPDGVDLSRTSFRVVRFDLEYTPVTAGQQPPAGAQGTSVGNNVYRLKAYTSTEQNITNGNKVTVSVVASGTIDESNEAAIADQILVLEEVTQAGGSRIEVLKRIKIGPLNEQGEVDTSLGTSMPRQVVVVNDGSRAYVTLERIGAIAVVDLITGRQMGLITLRGQPTSGGQTVGNAAPYDIILTKDNRYALVSDRKSPHIYVIDLDKAGTEKENPDFDSHVHTFTYAAPTGYGLRGLALTPDGSELVVTSTTSVVSDEGVGRIIFYRMPDITEMLAELPTDPQAGILLPVNRDSTFDKFRTAVLRQPFGVTTAIGPDGKMWAFVTDKGEDGVGVMSFRRDPSGWVEVHRMPFGFTDGFRNYSFEPNDAAEIVITSDNRYAFVMAQNRYQQGDATRDPNYVKGFFDTATLNPLYPAGSAVAVIADPFSDLPTLVGALRPLQESWATELALSGDGRYLYASGGNQHAVMVYDVAEIEDVVTRLRDTQYFYAGNRPVTLLKYAAIDDVDPDTLTFTLFTTINNNGNIKYNRTGVNTDIDHRADYALWNKENTFELRVSSPDSDNAPIGTGPQSLPTGFSSQTPFIDLKDPVISESGQITLPWTLNNRDLEAMLYVSVLGPGDGLFPSDTSQAELDYLFYSSSGLKLPYDAPNSQSDRLLLADANRNRIFARLIKPPTEGDTFTVMLPDNIELTRGQTYFWGVEVLDEEGRLIQKSGTFTIPVKQSAGGFTGVTIVTHGFEALSSTGAAERPTFEIAKDIAENTNGVVAVYQPNTGKWVSVTNGRSLTSGQGGELVLVVDWVTDSLINDSGFSEAAADGIYASLVKLFESNTGLSFAKPIHFIGEGRGVVVNSEIAERILARHGSATTDIHFTSIDPADQAQPQLNLPWTGFAGMISALLNAGSIPTAFLAPPVAKGMRIAAKAIDAVRLAADVLGFGTLDWTVFRDPTVTYWTGIDYFDNYYQDAAKSGSSLTVNGRSIPEANVNRYLGSLPGFQEDDEFPGLRFDIPLIGGDFLTGWNTTHNRTIAYYGGTADLNRQTFGAAGTDEELIWRSFSTLYALKDETTDYRFGSQREGSRFALARFYPSLGENQTINISSWYRGFQTQGLYNLFPGIGGGAVTGPLPSKNDSYPFEGIGEGWYYSYLGGGQDNRFNRSSAGHPTPGEAVNTSWGNTKEAIPDIFNGDFESTFRPLYGRTLWLAGEFAHGYEIPGWSFHGGTGGVGQGFLSLDAQISTSKLDKAIEDLGLGQLGSIFKSSLAGTMQTIVDTLSGRAALSLASPAQFSADIVEFLINTAEDTFKKVNYAELGRIQRALQGLATKYASGIDASEKLLSNKDFSANLRNDITTGVAIEVARVLVPLLMQWMQSDILTYGLRLSAVKGKDTVTAIHNRFEVADDLTQLGFDVRGPGSGANGVLQVVFVDFEGHDRILKTKADQVENITFGSTTGTINTRVVLDIPSDLHGKIGTLEFRWTFPPDDDGNPLNNSSVSVADIVIDNINRDGMALSITDSSGEEDDGVLYFDDDLTSYFTESGSVDGNRPPTRVNTDNADLTAIAKSESGPAKIFRNGHNEHTITISNDSNSPRKVVLRLDAGSFVTVYKQESNGTFTEIAFDTPSSVPGSNQFVSAPITVTRESNVILRVRVAMTLEELRALEGPGIHKNVVSFVELDANNSVIDTRDLNFYYLVDAGDDSTTDGIIKMRDTVEGQKRTFTLTGAEDFDTVFDRSTRFGSDEHGSRRSEWFVIDSGFGSGSNPTIAFIPRQIGSETANNNALVPLQLKVGDKVIGEVWIGGEGHKAQAIDINQYGHGLIEAGEDLLQYWSSLDPEDLDDEVFGDPFEIAAYNSFANAHAGENGIVFALGTDGDVLAAGVRNGIYDIFRELGVTGAFNIAETENASKVYYTTSAVTRAEKAAYEAWLEIARGRDSGTAHQLDANPAPVDEARLDLDYDKLWTLTIGANQYLVSENLTPQQILYRLDEAVNTRPEDYLDGIKIAFDAAVRSYYYDIKGIIPRPESDVLWESDNYFFTLGERIGRTIVHEFLHNLGFIDEYDADGNILAGYGRDVMSVRFETTLSDNQKMLLALALNMPTGEPTPEQAKTFAQWYLNLARKDSENFSDPEHAFAPGGGGDDPQPSVLQNGDFEISDIANAAFGWDLVGEAAIGSGFLTLSEGIPSDGSASQTAVKPATATDMRFTIVPNLVANDGPSDAFEIALLDPTTMAPVTAIAAAGTDALFNLQADGTVTTAPGVTVTGLDANGKAVSGQAITVTVDLRSVAAGTALKIYLDLLGFGALGSSVTVDDIAFFRGANHPPVAVDDTVAAVEDTAIVFDARANDTDDEGDPLTVSVVTPPQKGTVVVLADGTFRYTPDANANGTDSFTYRAFDGFDYSEPATVTIEIAAVNDAPTLADPGTITVAEGQTVTVQLQLGDIETPGAVTVSLVDAVDGVSLTPAGVLTVTGIDGDATADI
ncbi:MAG: cadherin-like domain-containing protein, partial [Rhodobiaceae bacterium]|nr:cadherin-like domain-containing protein [Rhodobiaceae bacterium]